MHEGRWPGAVFWMWLCAFAAMLVINFFALKISTIVLLLLAGGLSLGIFLGKGGKKA